MEKYLFLYLKTGGGHLAPAKAVAEKIKTKRRVDVEILLVDGFSESNIFVKKVIEDGYKNAINKALKLKNKYGIDNLKVYGFVDFVHSLVSISDIVITKCGASTSMEILIMGKVPVINNYIWEQEKGNMEFVCRGEMGILEKNTRFIPDVLHRLLTDNAFYNSLCNNIKNSNIRNGVGKVSDYILNYQY